MKRFFLFLFAALLPLMAGAQNLVVFDAGVLASSQGSPAYVVLTEKDADSREWFRLEEKLERYGAAHAFDGAEQGVGDPDWDEYIRDLEKGIADYTREGNKEGAQMYREMLAEAKKMRAEVEAQAREVREQSRSGGEGLDRNELRAEVLKHAVGGRFFYSAQIYLGRLACVQAKPVDGDQNVFGLMDAQGKMVVPARYWTIFLRDWPNGNGKGLVLAYRLISDEKTEVSLFWDDGTPASQQSFAAAKIFDDANLIGVRLGNGSWSLMNADARVITQRQYKKLDWNTNDLIDSSKGTFVYGERDGVNYIISPKDGSEIGTFKQTFNADGSTTHDVNYYPGLDPGSQNQMK